MRYSSILRYIHIVYSQLKNVCGSMLHLASNLLMVFADDKEKDKFEDLHKSILACDEVLKSVETYLTNFQTDLAAVSAEIESLQNRSIALNTKLQNRKVVEKLLGPAVEDIS